MNALPTLTALSLSQRTRALLQAADATGHPFRGNQWTQEGLGKMPHEQWKVFRQSLPKEKVLSAIKDREIGSENVVHKAIKEGKFTVDEIANHTGIVHGSVGGALMRLQRKGIIKISKEGGFDNSAVYQNTKYAPVTATLAARVSNLLRAAEVSPVPTVHPHSAPRAAAIARYQAAVDDFTAHAKAIVLSKSKKKREQLKALFLLLMLDAGDEAYSQIYPALAKVTPPATGPTPIKPGDMRAEAEAFARGRQEYLEDFPSAVFDRLDAARQQAEADGQADKEVRAALNRTATEIKQGQGEVVAETEGQATYGAAEIRVLKRAGYKTKRWQTEEDERVRDSHENCQLQGEIDIDANFSNGLRYPGQTGAPASEVCNCRCWLVGGAK